ncbi:MAG: UvrD-helicase domain-containing protein [Myxococcota bacterium]
MTASNFACLEAPAPDLAATGRLAEAAFVEDPRSAMGHLRRFGEQLAVELLERHRLATWEEPQIERLRRLHQSTAIDRELLDDLHTLRKVGNGAVHLYGDAGHADAMRMLKAAARLARWYWTDYTARKPPAPGAFVKPTAPDRRADTALIRAELEAERKERTRKESELEAVLRLLEMPQVATHHGIEAAFQRLTEDQQSRVAAFLQRFREEPIHADWPMVQPDGMSDDKLRFVRVGELVVTVIAPPRADVVLVVHVGTEAEERAWAAGKQFQVNAAIGTLQVFDVPEAEAAAVGAGGLFGSVTDADLVRVGLPAALLPAVRALATEADLDHLSPHLPPESSDALYLLASGEDLEKTLDLLDRAKAEAPTVDTEDFAAAVQHPESKRSFLLVEGPDDLDAVLRGSVKAWRLYLHPDQRKLVRMRAKGPIQVLGGAGTGKTVALLHRVNHLATRVFVEPTDRLLVTTYTRNLAADLQHQLSELLAPEDFARVDIVNLHALAQRMWTDHGTGRSVATDDQRKRAWERALTEETLGLSDSFYKAEWVQVVQAEGLVDETSYLRVRREGRTVTLDRGKRRVVWKVLAAFRSALDGQQVADPLDPFLGLREGLDAERIPRSYVAALIDETQDFGIPELRFVRSLIAPRDNDLFFVGDAHQRIYGYPVRMSRCGIEIVGRSRRLRVNYRTTAEVRAFAVAALVGQRFDDLDGEGANLKGYHSVRIGTAPEVRLLRTAGEERTYVQKLLERWLGEVAPEAICVAAPTNRGVEQLHEWLVGQGVAVTAIRADASDQGTGVRLATFHRLKGLEFPRVVLTGIQDGLMPMRAPAYYELSTDEREVWDRAQRCLLYVAASRARDELVVTGFGTASSFLRPGRSGAHLRGGEERAENES